MKTVTLTVEITVSIPDDLDPSEVTFRGIEYAVPQTGKDTDVGVVVSYMTQEYFEPNPRELAREQKRQRARMQ